MGLTPDNEAMLSQLLLEVVKSNPQAFVTHLLARVLSEEQRAELYDFLRAQKLKFLYEQLRTIEAAMKSLEAAGDA